MAHNSPTGGNAGTDDEPTTDDGTPDLGPGDLEPGDEIELPNGTLVEVLDVEHNRVYRDGRPEWTIATRYDDGREHEWHEWHLNNAVVGGARLVETDA